MAFTVIKKSGPGAGRPVEIKPAVKMTRSTYNGITISFNGPMLANLKWIKGDKIEVALGSGPDDGWLAIRRSPEGYALHSDGSKNRLKTSLKSTLPGPSVPRTEATWEMGADDTLYVRIPSVFLASHQPAVAGRGAFINSTQMVAAE